MTNDQFTEGRLFEKYNDLWRIVGEIESLGGRLPQELGRSPDGSGHSAKPEPCSTVSALRASVLNADRCLGQLHEWREEDMTCKVCGERF